MRLEPTDAGRWLRDWLKRRRHSPGDNGQVQVLAEFENDTPLARADAQRSNRLSANLLANAVRHTPRAASPARSLANLFFVRVDVRDTGEESRPMKCRIVLSAFSEARAQKWPRGRRPGARAR